MAVTDLELESRLLGGLPIVNVFYERLGLDRLLETQVRPRTPQTLQFARYWFAEAGRGDTCAATAPICTPPA